MGQETLIDTEIIIDALRGDTASKAYLRTRQLEGIYISSVTAFELFFGAMKSTNKKNKEATQTFIERVHVLEFDVHTAQKAAELHTQLAGQEIDFRDLFIAATAIIHDCKLKTRNNKHFSRVPKLRLA